MYKFQDMAGKYITYKSDTTKGEIWNGLVRTVEPDDDGEVEINGCRHKVDTITVTGIIQFNDGVIKI